MITFLILLYLFVAMFVGHFKPKDSIYYRKRSPREEALHGQVQQAMNWSPYHAKLCEDGKYRDAFGKEYVCLSLEEWLKLDDELFLDKKHITPEDQSFIREMNKKDKK